MDFGKESSRSEWRSFSECGRINCFLNRRDMFSSVSHRESTHKVLIIFSLNGIEKNKEKESQLKYVTINMEGIPIKVAKLWLC